MVLFGRNKEIARIRALIRSPRESALIVTGGHGSGKSSLLAEIPTLNEYRQVLIRSMPMCPLISAEPQEYIAEKSVAALGRK
ncbi:ATP-binding protein [Arthrobacter sp. YAF17]|uniref:ATP-binding protein n=1 Tax=Arthrobacter sp. YAF17 TaxID=3233077 RepID=UPI003F91CA04